MPRVDPSPLFTPFTVKGLTFKNRFIMPAMQRKWCANGEPLPVLVDYYRERAAGGVSLIITESCAIDHPSSTQETTYARLSDTTFDAWRRCIDVVRDAGAPMFVQLWHEGAIRQEDGDGPYSYAPTLSPSGLIAPGRQRGRAATVAELEEIKAGFVRSALLAKAAGAVGVEVHSCHGYLLDQFLWSKTNLREDGYGGPELAARIRFPAEIVAAVRNAVGPEFVIGLRFSQWKQADYDAKIVANPDELRFFLDTMRKAGADLFHASTRRFFTPEWPESDLGLAGWTKSLTDRPVIACGSVGVDTDVMDNFLVREAKQTGAAGVAELVRRFDNKEFDIISVGRAVIGDPQWVNKVQDGRYADIRGFTRADIMPATRDANGVRVR
jgi:2,4-dienoyl-CoA reductase-like NADH-dependent reductase (Old Yellow Enzyme family)